jgi:hypothetical protein
MGGRRFAPSTGKMPALREAGLRPVGRLGSLRYIRSRWILQGLTLCQVALAWEAAQGIRGLTQGQALRGE